MGTTAFTSASLCDGSGTCVSGTASDCGAYRCRDDGTACHASPCVDSNDCSSGNACQTNLTCAP
jgi:hypothetical protein